MFGIILFIVGFVISAIALSMILGGIILVIVKLFSISFSAVKEEFDEMEQQKGMPLLYLINLCMFCLLLPLFYYGFEFDGLASYVLTALLVLFTDVLLYRKSPELLTRKINFLWLWSI